MACLASFCDSVWLQTRTYTQGSYQMACLASFCVSVWLQTRTYIHKAVIKWPLLPLFVLVSDCKPEPINTRQLSNGLSYLLLHLGVWFANQNLHTQGSSSNGLSCLLLLIGYDCKPEPIYTRTVIKCPVLPPFAFKCLIANQNLNTQGSYQMACLPFFLHLSVWLQTRSYIHKTVIKCPVFPSFAFKCLICKPEPIYTRQFIKWPVLPPFAVSVWLQTRTYIHKAVIKWPVLPPFAFRCLICKPEPTYKRQLSNGLSCLLLRFKCLIANQNLYTQGSYEMACLASFCI